MTHEPDHGAEKERQIDAAMAWYRTFHAQGDSHPCPVCGDHNWVYGPVMSLRRDATVLLGDEMLGWTLALTPVWCKTCSYTWFVNAHEAGIVDNSDPRLFDI